MNDAPQADPEHADRVIVGAGLAGSAAAIALARGGAPALLLERAAAQARPRICGEFVSAEAAASLAVLGVDVRALGGRPTQRLRLCCGAQRIDAELPFEAIGLTRQTLDGALQSQAERQGSPLRRGQRVGVTLPLPHARQQPDARRPFTLQLSGGSRIVTPTLLLACGKNDLSPLARRPSRPPEPLVGLQTHLVLAPDQAAAIDGHVEVLLFDGAAALAAVADSAADFGRAGVGGRNGDDGRVGAADGVGWMRGSGRTSGAAGAASHDGYAGLQPVEGGRVNLCLLVDRALARHGLAAALAALRRQCPLLDERLTGASASAEPPQSIAQVPYGYLHRSTDRGDRPDRHRRHGRAADEPAGLWRLGDQAAVIPSFTGDGMAIALHSAALAAQVLLAGGDAARYHRALCDDIGGQMARAMAIYRIGRWAPGRHALLGLLRRWPAALRFIATMTRVRPATLRLG